MNGWIKLHRQIMENPMYFAETFTRVQAWIDLLLLANHKTGYIYVRGNRVEVHRGQVGMSEESLAERWKWSRGKVRRFLKHLENEQQIVQQKSHIKSLISITNYEEYQQTGQQTEQQTEQQTDTNKNDKEEEERSNVHPNVDFDVFWNAYDKKVGAKDKLRRKWNKLTNAERTAIMEYLPRYKQAQPDKQFRKNPATFLNNRAWEDELIMPHETDKSKSNQFVVNNW